MKINKYAYCNTQEFYSLNVDDGYAQYLTDSLKQQAINPDDIPTITPEDICNIYSCEDASFENKSIAFKRWNYEETKNTYESYIYDTIFDWVDEDVWDSYVDSENGDCYDTEMEIIRD